MRVDGNRWSDGGDRRASTWLAAVAATLLLAGCTVFAEEEPEPATIQADTDESQFPNVGEVPDAAPTTTTPEERSVMLQQLKADQANAGVIVTETYVSDEQTSGMPGGGPVALIYFQNGSASLSEDDRSVIHEVAELQKASGGVIQIVGHASMATGTSTSDEANYDISLARANAVANALLREGVDSANVQVAAAGSTEPEYYEFTATGEAGNRRAEIYLVQ